MDIASGETSSSMRLTYPEFLSKPNFASVLIIFALILSGCASAGNSGGGGGNPPSALAISTNSLPEGQVGSAYGTTLSASGGTIPYSWSLASGTLPAGLRLNASTGAISGTPTAIATATPLTVQITDSGSPAQVKQVSLTLTISSATLAVTTTSLPSGQIGMAYSSTLVATGGATPYTWVLTSGTLPSGLTLNSSTGAISGTPTVAVTNASLTVKVTDSSVPAQSTTTNLNITISPATLSISTTTLPNGQVSTAYNATLAAAGGATPYSWSLTSGTLPSGLTLNSSTGSISGTPTVSVASTPLTFKVMDSGSPAQSKTVNLNLTISPATLQISTNSLPNGQIGTAYSATLLATGGATPYAWALISGTLPTGLSLNASSGAIAGTPTQSVTNTPLSFKVTDSSSPALSKTVNLTLTISPAPLQITTTSLPNGQLNTAYTATLTAIGGTTPYSWTLTSGTLPTGLTLNSTAGTVSGTPTVSVSNTALTFKLTDSSAPALTKSVNLTLTVSSAALVITTSSLPNGQAGVAYSDTLAAIGGITPYTWSLTSGTLPTGLNLNASTGAITGTPSAVITNLALTFRVTDSSAPALTDSTNLTLTIAPATLVISTTSLPIGQIGTAYSTALAATGGTTPYTWNLTSGTLPSGLTLNSSTGVVSGTPTVSVSSTPLTFKVMDTSIPAHAQTVNLTLTIAPATLAISTTSLPNGQNGTAYSTTLLATGGTTPFTWTLTGGTLPTGLNLNASTGVIGGTPTSTVTNTPLTFKVTDSGSPAQSKTVNLALTISPATLAIATTSLPNGQNGTAYSATLAATGGTTPYTWTLTSGTLPTGLNLNASTGAITGTPTVSVANTPLTFNLTDSSIPAQSKTVNLTLTISSTSNISVSITPKRGGLTLNQSLRFTAVVSNDVGSAGVSWSATAGTVTGQTTTASSFSASSAGVYTITATSVADSTKSASATIGVTDLSAISTYHNNLSRDGVNPKEYALTTSNVATATFGKLFSCAVDGAVYAQPLWVANLNISLGTHNVVFVATSHDSVYAFDADISPCHTYWHQSLLKTGETYVSDSDVSTGDIQPDIGIVGTPVIDTSTQTLYVVSKSKDSGTSCTPSSSCHQRLHGLSLIDGTEKFGGPAIMDSSIKVPGNGDGSSGGNVPFDPLRENQRPGLALVNGMVYISWASHGDNDPYHGWVIGFSANNLASAPSAVWNSTPNAVSGFPQSRGGIWMSGGAPAADSSNNLYFLTGNGSFDANSGGLSYGDSTVKLSTATGLSVTDYFTPSNQSSLNSNDTDHGSGGAAILVDQPGAPVPHLLIGGGKAGTLFLLNRDNMGHYSTTLNNVVQSLNFSQGIFATSAFWNGNLYLAGVGGPLKQYSFNATTGLFGTSSVHSSGHSFGFPGATPSVTSTGAASNGIVWALDNSSYCTEQAPSCGAATLHAFDATNVNTELWNSSLAAASRDKAGNPVKFTVPTIANGKVYIGTRGNNTGGTASTTTIPGELDVYGLLPN